MGTAVKWFATHVRRRLPGNAELEQHLAFGCAFSHHMPAIVCAVKDVVGVDMKAVRARVHAFAPGAQKVSVAVEHHHRVFAAVEHIDLVLAVDRDRGDILELPAGGQLRPVFYDTVTMLAATHNDSHHGSFLKQWDSRLPGAPGYLSCAAGSAARVHRARSDL